MKIIILILMLSITSISHAALITNTYNFNNSIEAYSTSFTDGFETAANLLGLNNVLNIAGLNEQRDQQFHEINGFDSSLGTLNGVSMTFDSTFRIDTTFYLIEQPGLGVFFEHQGASRTNASVSITLHGQGVPRVGTSHFGNEAADCKAGASSGFHCTEHDSLSENMGGNLFSSTDATSIEFLIDQSFKIETFSLVTSKLTSCFVSITFRPPSTCLAIGELDWNPALTIAWDYTPVTTATVPAPAPLRLMLIGLAGLFVTFKRHLFNVRFHPDQS